jgi:glycosyltransferase involved in cell wall biosynthesis
MKGVCALSIDLDVCVVTKEGFLPKGLEFVPANTIVIETSRPLAMARMRAIKKVQAEWFAFIDDDVEIKEGWFQHLWKFVEDDIGAIAGCMDEYGLGERWDRVKSEFRRKKSKIRFLKKEERGWTHNTLIRTKVVKDWKPSREDLEAFEDYELTQHIINKGYKWLSVPSFDFARHRKTWKSIWEKGKWTSNNFAKIKSRRSRLKRAVECLGYAGKTFLFSTYGWRLRIVLSYEALAYFNGLIRNLL